MHSSHSPIAACLAVMVLAGSHTAFAQTPATGGSSRPYGGLFGGRGGSDSKQSLDFMMSLSEGYNNDTSRQLSTVIDPTSGPSDGLQTLLVANGGYTRRGASAQFAVNGASVLAYFNDVSETRSLSHTIGIGFNAQLSQKTSVLVNQGAAYSPTYLYALFPGDPRVDPGDAVPTAPEYSVQSRETYAYNTSLGLTHIFTRRNKMSVWGEFNYVDYMLESDTLRDMRVASLRSEFSRNVKRNTVVTLGYRLRNGNVGFGVEQTTEHGVDVAVDHNRPLSATRRAFIGLRLGSSTLELPSSALITTSVQNARRYFVDGQVSMGYQFSRGWQTRAIYRRGMEYVPALIEPVFTDGLTVNVDGLLTRRLDLTLSGGYSSGESALHRNVSALETYAGDARLRFAVNRTLAAYVQYLYYFYDFSGNTQLAFGMPRRLERNAVRAGFMLWLPVVQR